MNAQWLLAVGIVGLLTMSCWVLIIRDDIRHRRKLRDNAIMRELQRKMEEANHG